MFKHLRPIKQKAAKPARFSCLSVPATRLPTLLIGIGIERESGLIETVNIDLGANRIGRMNRQQRHTEIYDFDILC